MITMQKKVAFLQTMILDIYLSSDFYILGKKIKYKHVSFTYLGYFLSKYEVEKYLYVGICMVGSWG